MYSAVIFNSKLDYWGITLSPCFYCLILDSNLQEEKALRNSKRFTTIDTRKDGIRFNNSALRQLNEQFQGYKETYNDVQSKLANEVIKVAGM